MSILPHTAIISQLETRIINPLVFPFRFATSGTDTIMVASGLVVVTVISLWTNGANSWRMEVDRGAGQRIPLIPAAGFAMDFLANQGYLEHANFVSDCEGDILQPIVLLNPGESLVLTRGGTGEIVGAIKAVSIIRK